jgi:hypothetical protein
MIYGRGIRIWTEYGFLDYSDLRIGDKVISFNSARNCCEYDSIKTVEIGWVKTAGFSIRKKGMYQWLTPDHPILIYHKETKEVQKISIESAFGKTVNNKKSIVYNRPFEPYSSSCDIEDILWSARLLATYSKTKYLPIDTSDFWKMLKSFGGYEAQQWLDCFLHWNSMLFQKNWMFTIFLNNYELRDMIFEAASRAGVGANHRPYIWSKNKMAMHVAHSNDINIQGLSGWRLDPIDGPVFNVTTKNGNMLVRTATGNFIMACGEIGE